MSVFHRIINTILIVSLVALIVNNVYVFIELTPINASILLIVYSIIGHLSLREFEKGGKHYVVRIKKR